MQKICIINKNKSNINNKDIKEKIKVKNNKGKFIIVMSLIIMFASCINTTLFASDVSEQYGTYRIFSYEDSNRYIKYKDLPQRIHEYYYLNKSGVKLPAYCMNLGLNGAETVENGYNVNVNEIISDKDINHIIISGYPYKTVSELSLENESQARYATQFAIWIKLNNLDINSIVAMEGKYQNIVNAIKNIYYNGMNFNSNFTNGIVVNEIKKDIILDTKDPSYYSKEYNLEYGDNIVDITANIDGIKDYIVTDENNNKLDKIIGNKKIKILFKRQTNQSTGNCNIEFNTTYKENAVIFGISENSGMQNVSLTLEPISTMNNKINFKYDSISTKLIIVKKDADNNDITIPNVKFQIYNEKNENIGEYTTDKEGKINLELEKDLKIFDNVKLKIKEIEVPYPYVIDENECEKEIELKVGETAKVEFKNKKAEEVKKDIKIELPKTGC